MSDKEKAAYLRGYRAGRKQGTDMTSGEFYDAAVLAALTGMMGRHEPPNAKQMAQIASDAAFEALAARRKIRE